MSNDVGVTLAGYDPFRVRLLQGVFDTNVEARIESSQPDATNPAWAFDAGGNWIRVQSPQDPQFSAVQLSADVVSRMTSDLRTGYAVVGPSSPLAVGAGRFEGWWQIDQRTGRTLGIGPNGWGPTMAERIILWGEIAAVGFLSSYVLCKIQGGDKGNRGPGAFADPEPSGQPWLDALSPPLYARRLNPCITEGLISALTSTLFAFLDGIKWPGGGGPGGGPGGGGPGGGEPGGGGPGGGGPGGGGPGGGGPGGSGPEGGGSGGGGPEGLGPGGEPLGAGGSGGGGGRAPEGGGEGSGSEGGGISRGWGRWSSGSRRGRVPESYNEDMKQGWREMEGGLSAGQSRGRRPGLQESDCCRRQAGRRPQVSRRMAGERLGTRWRRVGRHERANRRLQLERRSKHGHRLRVGNGYRQRFEQQQSSAATPTTSISWGRRKPQDLVVGATCPVPCASPLATSQAGLGNMTQLLGKH